MSKKITLIPMMHVHPQTGSNIDPVCGMTVDPDHAAGSYEYAGKTYYFCNPSCLNRFKAEPERYLSAAPTVGRLQGHPALRARPRPFLAHLGVHRTGVFPRIVLGSVGSMGGRC